MGSRTGSKLGEFNGFTEMAVGDLGDNKLEFRELRAKWVTAVLGRFARNSFEALINEE